MVSQIYVFVFCGLFCLSSHAQVPMLTDQFGAAHPIKRETFFAADADGRALLLQTVQLINLKQQHNWHWVLNIAKLPYSVINLNLMPSLLRLKTPIMLDSNSQVTGHWPTKKGKVSLIHPGKNLKFFTSTDELLTYINKHTASTTP